MITRPVLLVANEHSRRGGEIASFAATLERGGFQLRRETCADRTELSPLIRGLRDEIGAVILAGGDGTLNAGATALRETGLPLGILPLGTANDLARTLGIPNEPEAAASIILAGRTRLLDLGTVNEQPFFNVASLGMTVAVTRRLNRAVKRRFGILAYPISAAGAVLRSGRFRAVLRIDGEEKVVTTLQIAVGNGRFYGGGMVVAEDAAIDDATLHVYSLEPRVRWWLLFMGRAFRAGEHDKINAVRTFRCKTIDVATRRPRTVCADGEFITRTPAHFAVLPQAVRVFVP
ncbi:MAG: lipid kinase [Acetobacteraceae bacterium]|nr:lipid kinase [Acetobacteraceae bacterium]